MIFTQPSHSHYRISLTNIIQSSSSKTIKIKHLQSLKATLKREMDKKQAFQEKLLNVNDYKKIITKNFKLITSQIEGKCISLFKEHRNEEKILKMHPTNSQVTLHKMSLINNSLKAQLHKILTTKSQIIHNIHKMKQLIYLNGQLSLITGKLSHQTTNAKVMR